MHGQPPPPRHGSGEGRPVRGGNNGLCNVPRRQNGGDLGRGVAQHQNARLGGQRSHGQCLGGGGNGKQTASRRRKGGHRVPQAVAVGVILHHGDHVRVGGGLPRQVPQQTKIAAQGGKVQAGKGPIRREFYNAHRAPFLHHTTIFVFWQGEIVLFLQLFA